MFRAVWGLTVKPLCQDRRRSTLSVLGIALGIALIFSVDLSIGRARDSIQRSGLFVQGADAEIASRFGRTIPEAVYARALKVPGVTLLPMKVGTARLVPEGEEVLFIAADLVKLPYFMDGAPVAGARGTMLESLRSPSVYVGPGLVNGKDNDSASWICLEGPRSQPERLKVLGLLPETLFSRRMVLADLSYGERFIGPGMDRILVRVLDPERKASVLETLRANLTPDLSLASPQDRILRTEDVIRSFDFNLQALSYMALLIGMFLVYNTIFVSTVRRRTEIGILRALGLTRGEVIGLFVFEAVIIGTLGSFLGVFFGALVSSISDQGVTATLRSLYGLQILTPDGSMLRWVPVPLSSGILGSIVASVGPAYEASWIPPAEAMREGTRESRTKNREAFWCAAGTLLILSGVWTAFSVHLGRFPIAGFGGLLMLVVGYVLTVPWITRAVARKVPSWVSRKQAVEIHFGVRNILGGTGRTAMAVSAIAVSLGCTLGILMLVHSFRVTVEEWVDGNLSADVYIKADSCRGRVFCTEVLDEQTIERLKKVPGVRDLYAFRTFEFDFRGQKTHIGFSDVKLLHRYSRLRYLGGVDPERVFKEMTQGPYALVSEPFAHRFGIAAGDTVKVPTASGETLFTVSAVFLDYSTELGYMILDRRFLEPLFGVNDAHTLGLYFDPAISADQLVQAIQDALGGTEVVFLKADELRTAVLTIFDRTFAVTRAIYAIALVIALMAVANTLFALVVDRRREISVLRYLGMDGRQLFRMVLSESALIALTGSVSGALLGLPIGVVLIYVVNRQSFGWSVDFHLPALSMGGMFLGMLLVTVASSWFPFRLAAQISPSRHISHE